MSEQEQIVTEDELNLIGAFRSWVGGPYIAALTEEQKMVLNSFIKIMQESKGIPSKIH